MTKEEDSSQQPSIMARGDSSSSPKENKKIYKMVALDLDGTLLQNNHEMSDVQADYLREMHSKGLTICFATGRAAPSVYEHVKKLHLPTPIPVVCSNGAQGFYCDNQGKPLDNIFYNPVPKPIVLQTIRLAKEHGFAVQYYFQNSIYVCHACTESLKKLVARYSRLTGSTIHPVEEQFLVDEMLEQKDQLPSKLLVLVDSPRLKEAEQLFQSHFQKAGSTPDATLVLGHFSWFIEILNPKVTKGHGLGNMCDALGIPIEECIAMGDGHNDLEFLQMAGLGVAMQNAQEVVKQVADQTMEWTNNEHGVMKTLQHLYRQGSLHLLEDEEV